MSFIRRKRILSTRRPLEQEKENPFTWEKFHPFDQKRNEEYYLTIRERKHGFRSYEEHDSFFCTLCKDQAFWVPLLPVIADKESCVLVVDDSFGSLSCRLSKYFGRVFSLQLMFDEAINVKRTAFKTGADNVLPIQFSLSGNIPIRQGVVSAVILLRLSGTFSLPLKGQSSQLLDYFLGQLDSILNDDGVIIVADNNVNSYKLFKGKFKGERKHNGYSMTTVRNALLAKGLYLKEYIGKFAFERDLSPLPEFVNYAHAMEGEPKKIRIKDKLKQNLLKCRVFHRFWPSFLFLAGKTPFTEKALRILEHAFDKESKYFERGKTPEIKRVIAGNAEITIMIVGPVGTSGLDLVLRIPSLQGDTEKHLRSAAILKELETSNFGAYVPKLLASGTYEGQLYFIEEKKSGRSLDDFSPAADQYIANICETFLSCQAASFRKCIFSEKEYHQYFGKEIEKLGKYCTADEKTVLFQLDGLFKNRLLGETVSLVRTHGDFKDGNVLFDEKGDVSGIIDWDLSEEAGLPIMDMLSLMTYRISIEENRSLWIVYQESILPWNVRSFYKNILSRAVEIHGVDEKLLTLFRGFFWILNLNNRISWVIKTHDARAGIFIGDTLKLIKQELCRKI